MKVRLWPVALTLLALVAILGCQAAPSPAASPSASGAITMSGLAFHPSTITVKVGATVTWTNNEGVNHTVTSDTGLFDSGNMPNGGTYSYTFTSSGTFHYHCTIHKLMKGTVIVQ